MYFVLTLPETVSTYLGLALQMLLRQHVLRLAVGTIVLVNLARLIYVHRGTEEAFEEPFKYGMVCLLLVALFWPDITPWGRNILRQIDASQVSSYAASQDPDAELVTGEDVRNAGQSPQHLVASYVGDTSYAIETPGFRLLLRGVTDASLGIAKLLNAQTYKPLSPLVPMQWLMGMEMTAELTRYLSDWLEGCYKPALLTDREFQEGLSAQQLSPWGNSPVAQALGSRSTKPGAHVGGGYFQTTPALGIETLSNPDSPQTLNCLGYLAAVEVGVQRMLYTTKSPNGTPLSQVFDEELGLDAQQQGRMLLWREMMRLMKGPVPGPSLSGAYSTTAGVNVVTRALNGALQGATSPKGSAAVGAGTAAAGAITSRVDEATARLLWWLGWAMWAIWWLPDTMGILEMFLVGFFPIVFLWWLWPGQQFRGMLYYTATLFWCYSSPIWFATTDLFARSVASRTTVSQDAIVQILNWPAQQVNSVIATMIGMVVSPIIMGLLVTGAVYGVSKLTRASVPTAA